MKIASFAATLADLNIVVDSFTSHGERAAIVGGNYFLMYQESTDSLAPAVYQDFVPEEPDQIFARTKAGDFPTRSFEAGIQLMLHLRGREVEARFVLAVDDDTFQKKNFRSESHTMRTMGRTKELRLCYFSSENNLPLSFKEILRKYGQTIDSTFQRFNYSTTQNGGYVPPNSIFLSERKLCDRFKKTLKNNPQFNEIGHKESVSQYLIDSGDLIFDIDRVQQICLIEQGVCNCGGKSLQFYLDLIKIHYQTIVFFVPRTCVNHVREGAQMLMDMTFEYIQNVNVIIISFQEHEDNISVENKIHIHYFSTQKK